MEVRDPSVCTAFEWMHEGPMRQGEAERTQRGSVLGTAWSAQARWYKLRSNSVRWSTVGVELGRLDAFRPGQGASCINSRSSACAYVPVECRPVPPVVGTYGRALVEAAVLIIHCSGLRCQRKPLASASKGLALLCGVTVLPLCGTASASFRNLTLGVAECFVGDSAATALYYYYADAPTRRRAEDGGGRRCAGLT